VVEGISHRDTESAEDEKLDAAVRLPYKRQDKLETGAAGKHFHHESRVRRDAAVVCGKHEVYPESNSGRTKKSEAESDETPVLYLATAQKGPKLSLGIDNVHTMCDVLAVKRGKI